MDSLQYKHGTKTDRINRGRATRFALTVLMIDLRMMNPLLVSTPSVGRVKLFIDSSDGRFKAKHHDGNIVDLGLGAVQPPIYIPSIQIRTITVKDSTMSHMPPEVLQARWVSPSNEFLALNPKIVLLRPRNTKKKFIRIVAGTPIFYKKKVKKMSHPTNGGNGGEHNTLNFTTGYQNVKRTTEFGLPTNQGEWALLPVDPFQWFYKKLVDSNGDFTGVYDYLSQSDVNAYDPQGSYRIKALGDRYDRVKMAFAISIDDPTQTHRITGPVSPILTLRLTSHPRYRLTYMHVCGKDK